MTAARETPAQRSMHARLAANTRWSKEDPKDPNGPLVRARAAFWAKLLHEVDPDGVLPEAERDRRAECARKAFYQRLAMKSAAARRRRQASGGAVAALLALCLLLAGCGNNGSGGDECPGIKADITLWTNELAKAGMADGREAATAELAEAWRRWHEAGCDGGSA